MGAEMNALNRRVQNLEEDLEKTEEKLVAANSKLDKAGTAADDSERAKKVFENKAVEDDRRIAGLEKELKEARDKAEAADAAYEEVSKKLLQCDSDLEKAEERADTGETKILELEEELRVVANNLKSLEVAEEKANQREKSYKEQIKTLTAKSPLVHSPGITFDAMDFAIQGCEKTRPCQVLVASAGWQNQLPIRQDALEQIKRKYPHVEVRHVQSEEAAEMFNTLMDGGVASVLMLHTTC